MLRMVHRAGHLTIRQLFESLNISATAKTIWDSFRWRIRRLVQHDFLERAEIAGLGPVISLGSNGELFLQSAEPTIIERTGRTGRGNRRDQVWHDVEVFEINTALRRAGVIRCWQFETEIRAENDFTHCRYRKDYDAIVTFSVNGRSARVALEYERTCKSTGEYERICSELNLETRVPAFLYLAGNPQLQAFLVHGFRLTKRHLYVGTMQEFCADPYNAGLIDVRMGTFRRLTECLDDAE